MAYVMDSILKDPKYDDCTMEERSSHTLRHHYDRMERALTFIRSPVKCAVERYFYGKLWIQKLCLKNAIPFRQHSNLMVMLYTDEGTDVLQESLLTVLLINNVNPFHFLT